MKITAATVSDDELRKNLADIKRYGSQRKAAEALNMPRETLRSRVNQAAERGLSADDAAPFEIPMLPPDGLPASEILEHMARRFEIEQAHRDAIHWMPIKVRDPGPMAICWFGDPHLGNNGCNVPRLLGDVKAVAAAPHCYGANIGDTVDNWGGRLIRLYAENDVSRKTERKLARWFLQESGVRWIVWLLGNHDMMDGALSAYMEGIGASCVRMTDWRARFRLVFPNGIETRIDAAHNHKGHSMWNDLHGQIRASVFDEYADLFIAGHHHVWATHKKELSGGRVVSLARARGYKFGDDYGLHGGFQEQQHGCSIVTVIDPHAPPVGRITMFEDVQEGLDYLAAKRSRFEQ